MALERLVQDWQAHGGASLALAAGGDGTHRLHREPAVPVSRIVMSFQGSSPV